MNQETILSQENYVGNELVPSSTHENGSNQLRFHDLDPFDILLETNQELKSQNQSQFLEMKSGLDEITDLLKPKVKKQKIKLPPRDALTYTVYYDLMHQPIRKRERTVCYSRFRLALTLLWYSGLRINEIKTLTREDIQTICTAQTLNVYQPKVNKYKKVLFIDDCIDILHKMRDEIDLVFNDHMHLSGSCTNGSWIRFMNRRLIKYSRGKYIRSHSCRINYTTSLLKHADVQQVAAIVGHADVKTTMQYNRYIPKFEERESLLEKALCF